MLGGRLRLATQLVGRLEVDEQKRGRKEQARDNFEVGVGAHAHAAMPQVCEQRLAAANSAVVERSALAYASCTAHQGCAMNCLLLTLQ